MASLIYGSTHESSSKLHASGLYHTWNQDMDYLLCVSVCASSNYFLLLMTCHTLNKQMVSLLCGSSHAFSNASVLQSTCHNWNLKMAPGPIMNLQVSVVLKGLITFGTSIWLLSSVGQLMLFQMVTFCKCQETQQAKILSCYQKYLGCAFCENALSHFEQAYNFSPVWIK